MVIGCVCRSLSVPPWCRASGALATHIFVRADASATGSPPTRTLPATALRFGSMRETVPEYRFATQTLPLATSIADGPFPTGIVELTEQLRGSLRVTVP